MLAISLKNNKQQQKHRISEAKIHVQVEYDLQAPSFQPLTMYFKGQNCPFILD